MVKNRCPHCGNPLTNDGHLAVTVNDLLARCAVKRIDVADGNLVSEAGAAALLGFASADTLRKQVTECRDHPPFRRRGNRRLYPLDELLPWIPG